MKKINLKSSVFQGLSMAVLLMLSMSSSIMAQVNTCINTNGSFEDIINGCPTFVIGDCYPDAFHNQCVPHWASVHGSPDICSQVVNVSPPIGGGIFMSELTAGHSGPICYNEAIVTTPNLVPGNTYVLKFHHITVNNLGDPAPINLEIYQTHELAPTDYSSSGAGLRPCSELEIPSDSELIYSANDYSSNEWIEEKICFTALDFPKYQILFVPTLNSIGAEVRNWLIDLVCIEPYSVCTPTTDLTACADEENFGFIHFDCEDDLEFEWDFPQGSTALETCGGATILQASEGTYTVTITDESNSNSQCESVETFEITSDCCIACRAPTGLDCKTSNQINQFVRLGWDEVFNATDYEITIVTDSSQPNFCGCSGVTNTTATFNTGGIPYYDYLINPFSCFSWTVKAICEDGVSESSSIMCYNYNAQSVCFEPVLQRDERGETQPKTGSSNLKPRVYPNPSSGILNFELDGPKDLVLTVEVYSFDGKLVTAFAEEKSQDGIYRNRWSVDQQLTDGLYTVVFKTNYGTFQEKIIISANDSMQK